MMKVFSFKLWYMARFFSLAFRFLYFFICVLKLKKKERKYITIGKKKNTYNVCILIKSFFGKGSNTYKY